MASPFSRAAPYYVGFGWKVFPLSAGSKIPAKGSRGFKDASDDADVIDAWDRAQPNANVGIATGSASGILVVDIDPRNGGTDSIAKLAGGGFVFPSAPEARTGNGGRHLIFTHDARIRSSKDRLGRGIDIKADGGYIVGAPSIIAASEQGAGGEYRWIIAPQIRLPPLPRWVLDKILPTEKPNRPFVTVETSEAAAMSLEGLARSVARSGKGNRNNLLNWSAYQAGQLVRQGKLAPLLVTDRLIAAALAAGLSLAEAQATIASGLRAAGEGKP